MPKFCRKLIRHTCVFIQAALAVMLAAGACTAQQPTECQPCHGVSGFSVQASDGRIVNLHIDNRRYEASVHGNLLCEQCHVNMAIQPHEIVPISTSPEIRPYVAKWRPLTRPAAAECITCHRSYYRDYSGSIHATALKRGNLDSPFCSDCHGSHYIFGAEDLESQVNPENVPDTCASCHAVGLVMSRRDIATNTVETFRQSVHGRKLALGQTDVAVCTSCHGLHDIRSSRDPKSTIHPNNIVQTCRQCHEGASRSFALSFRHVTPSPTVEPVVYWVQVAYQLLIALIVGGMAAFIALDLYRRLLEWGRRRREARG